MVTSQKETSFYTQRMIEFFQGLKKHAGPEYPNVRKAVISAASGGKDLGYDDTQSAGFVLMATTVVTLGKHMKEAPDIVQACMAKILASEVDWSVVAERFLVDEGSN
jgi:hypothetical protein